MPRIPQYKQQRLPSTNIGAAPVRYAPSGGEAIGRGLQAFGAGIGDIGQSVAQIKAMDNKNKDSLAQIALRNDVEAAELEYKKKIAEDGDTTNWASYRDEAISKISIENYDWGSSWSKQAASAGFKGWSESFMVNSVLDAIQKRNDQNITVTEVAYIDGLTIGDDSGEQAYRDALGTKYTPDMVDILVNDAKAKGAELFKKASIDDIKPLLTEAVETQDKEYAYKVLENSVKTLVKEGTLTKTEAAQANKSLGDWLDNYVSGRIQQKKQNEKLTTRQTYQQLIPQLFDDSVSHQRYDLVEQSKLLKADKENWQKYIAGSYDESPTENTYKGHKESTATVFDAMMLKISPKDAYDELLESRFVDKSITDEQFNWAINKIENPYPKPIATALRAALKHNLTVGWFDNELDKEVNKRLIGYIDDLIEKDKIPIDLDKNLYAQSQKFRWGQKSGLEIEDVITINNNDWEVVGFDKNGEPLMEPK